jgi:hypothetical protein
MSTFPRMRNPRSYARDIGVKLPRKNIFIICEGSRTEPTYFKSLKEKYRLPTIQIEIIPGGKSRTAPDNMIDETPSILCHYDWNPKIDELWCVFDTDFKDKAEIRKVKEKASKKNIKLAITNPGFEYWLLLHHIKTDRVFNSNEELFNKLLEEIPDYNKSTFDFSKILSLTNTALANVSALRSQNVDDWQDNANPSTDVDQLVIACIH